MLEPSVIKTHPESMRTASRLRIAACVLTIGVLLTGCGHATKAGAPRPPAKSGGAPVVGPVVLDTSGRTLTGHAAVGGCTHAHLTAAETNKTVTLSLDITHDRKRSACAANSAMGPVSTTLSRPLGTRTVYDRATGRCIKVYLGWPANKPAPTHWGRVAGNCAH